jgi:hypothetical protein
METVVSRCGESGLRPTPLPENEALFAAFALSDEFSVVCSPRAAWKLVTDISRIGEFSPECIAADWIGGEISHPAVGARFEGTNRIVDEANETEFIWIRPCTVIACEPMKRFSYSVGDRYDGTPATDWTFEISGTPEGCRIAQQFRHLPDGLSGIRIQADHEPGQARDIVGQRTEGLRAGIRETLVAMKFVLEAMGAEGLAEGRSEGY